MIYLAKTFVSENNNWLLWIGPFYIHSILMTVVRKIENVELIRIFHFGNVLAFNLLYFFIFRITKQWIRQKVFYRFYFFTIARSRLSLGEGI